MEVTASNILSDSEWRVVSSSLYVDPDSGVTRELDINTLKIYKENSNNINKATLFSHLIIQCKKSDKPWVFFDNGGTDHFWLGYYSLKCGKDGFMTKLCFQGKDIGFNDHRYKDIRLHRSFHIAFSNPSRTSEIYDALVTSCKALEYFKTQYKESMSTAHFFTPIVVLDGTLWSANLDNNNKLHLKQVNKLVVKLDYIFGNDKKPNNYKHQYIEIITRKELKSSIKEIDKDNNTLLKSWVAFRG